VKNTKLSISIVSRYLENRCSLADCLLSKNVQYISVRSLQRPVRAGVGRISNVQQDNNLDNFVIRNINM
jgi:hypothetical protein